MARTSSQLKVSFLVETGALRSGFQRATRETDRFQRSTAKTSRATAALGGTLRRAAFAAAGAAAAYVSVAQARRAIETTQELALATMGLQRNLGMATEEASRWAAVTRARGIDSRTLTMSFTALAKNLQSVREGSETSIKTFRSLGITQKQLASTQGNFTQQVTLVAEAFGDAEGNATRQAAAQKLLGRGYRDILPMFTEGAKGLQEQLKWADQFGATMGKDTVDAMSDFTTAQRRGRVALMGLQIAFAKAATPAITDGINALGRFAAILNSDTLSKAAKMDRLRAEFRRLSDVVVGVVVDLAPMIAEAAGQIGLTLARAMGKAFTEANLLGKLAVASVFIRMLGGPAAIVAAGKSVGLLYSRSMAAGMAAGETFGLARSFGRGRFAAAGAAAGATAGGQIAASLAKGVARILPAALAGIAILDIVTNAISGDMKTAGIKAGGALVGGLAGFLLGGPVGALIGVGLGTFGADLGAKIIDSISGGARAQTPTLERQIAESTRRATEAARRAAESSRSVNTLDKLVTADRRAQAVATARVREAETNLANARARFGESSRQAARAERELAAAKRGVAVANDRVRQSERVRGAARQGLIVSLKYQTAEEKRVVYALKDKRDEIARGIRAMARSGASTERINERSEELRRTERRLARATANLGGTYARAGREIGPKLAATLRRASPMVLQYGRGWNKTSREVDTSTRGMGRSVRNWNNRQVRDWAAANQMTGAYVREITELRRAVANRMRELPAAVRRPLRNVSGQFRSTASAISGYGSSPFLSRRRGGLIQRDEGASPNSMVPVRVAPGEMLAYGRRAAIVPGTNDRADSVSMLLPVGTEVFTYSGQEMLAKGYGRDFALKHQQPHFRGGGIVRPKIVGGITDGRTVGNMAIDKTATIAERKILTIYKAMKKLYSGGAGVRRNYPNVSGDTDFVPALGWALSALAKATVGSISVTSGYRSYAEQAALYAANPNPQMVAPPGRSNHQRGIAADISPQRPSYGGAERRFGLSFPMSWEPWHIEVGSAPKFPSLASFDRMRKGGRTRAPWLRRYKRWGPDMLTTLAYYVGLPNASLMGRIAMGESGGNPRATNQNTNGTVDRGLWQINSVHGFGGNHFDPLTNALYAKRVYDRQGIGAWYAPPTGRGGRVNDRFLNIIHYSPAQRKAARKRARVADRRLDRLRRKNQNRGTKTSRRLARRAGKAVRRAKRAARQLDAGKARRAARRANRLISRGNDALEPRGSGGGNGGGGRPRPPKLTGTKSVDELLAQASRRGISRETRESLLADALTVAQGTETTDDDLIVLRRQRKFQQNARARARRRLAKANRMLAKKNLSKKERRKWLRVRNEALQALGQASSEITSINDQIEDIRGGGESGADLATAMKELADAINEQNRLQSSVQATSSREAIRMLSDVISGEIVGRRSPVSQIPTAGVRY